MLAEEVGAVAWLVSAMAVAVVLTAALLGHIGWLGRGVGALWHRVHPEPPHAENDCIEQLAADLRRLAEEIERVYRMDQPAKMARLTAAALAYDWVLLSAARTLDVPVPGPAPLGPVERLETEAALAAEGLDW